jgi:hypothetical protein
MKRGFARMEAVLAQWADRMGLALAVILVLGLGLWKGLA